MLINYSTEDILNNLDIISDEYPEDSFRTIWEIYCFQYSIDYDDDDTIHAKTFDIWVEQKKLN